MRAKSLGFLWIPFMMFTIGACGGKVEVSESTATPTLVARTSTVEITPTKEYLMYTPTPWPTVDPMQEQAVIELLNSEDCRLPCYLGITPHKTSVAEARQILISLGGRYKGDHSSNIGLTVDVYYLNLSINGMTPPQMYHGIIQSIEIYSLDDQVEAISLNVSVAGQDAMAKALSIWNRYTVKAIFEELGVPDYVYFDPLSPPLIMSGRELLIGYENKGVIVDIFGSGKINYLCSPKDAEHYYLNLLLFQDRSFVEKYSNSISMQLPTDQIAWVPVEDELKISVEQFYTSVMNDAVSCIEVDS